jgi:hypothetical protein
LDLEVADAAGRARDEDVAAEQVAAEADRVQGGPSGKWQGRRLLDLDLCWDLGQA